MFEFNNIESYPDLPSISTHDYFKEKIVLLYYNLSRKNSKEEIDKLSIVVDSLLCYLKQMINQDKTFIPYLELIFKMIAETRDCFYGKGEHDISYMLIFIFYKYYPVLASYLIYKFVKPLDNGSLGKVGYGSWRDMRYLCQYVREHSIKKEKDPIIEICIELMNEALSKDSILIDKILIENPDSIIQYRDHLSSVSKWIPRENKKFDWLHELLVLNWFDTNWSDFFGNVKDYEGYYMAIDKAKMLYRKCITKVNRLLDTTEIKLCSKQLNQILPKNVPQLCMNKYQHLFFNDSLKPKHLLRFFSYDNMDCYDNMKDYYYEKFIINKQGEFDCHRKPSMNIPNSGNLSYFIKKAYHFIDTNSFFNSQDIHIDVLNNQWKQMSEMIGNKQFYSFIPFLDLSFHHDKESLYSGIALAILISEHSSIRNRIMIIDQQPLWLNFDTNDTFFSKMIIFHKAVRSYQGTNSNIIKGFELFIDSFIETSMINKLHAMKIVFLHGEQSIEYKQIKELFYKKGMESIVNLPLSIPSIIYWNLSQKYIDTILFDNHCFYLSGFSPFLLKNLYLCKKNRSIDSFQIISNILGKIYYDDLRISNFQN
jgi:hypothetical protein